MKIKNIALLVASVLLATACQDDKSPQMSDANQADTSVPMSIEHSSSQTETAAEQNLERLYEQAMQTLFQHRQVSASMFGLSPQVVGTPYAEQMEDFSIESESNLRRELRNISKQIAEYPQQGLDPQAIENQEVMASITRYYAGHADFPVGYIDSWMGLSPFIVNQINGPLIDIPRAMQNDQKVDNLEDAQAYLNRLGLFDQMIASIAQKLDADVARGWVAPKVTLKGAEKFLRGFISGPAESHLLVNALKEKLDKVDNIEPKQKEQLLEKATSIVREVVYPAYEAMADKTAGLVDKARTESGIWAQPNGAQYYQDAILQLGDSQLSAEQIHQIGLDEVARISAEMDSILKAQGYQKGTVGERMVKLTNEPRFLYPDSAEGRKALLTDLNGYIKEITQKMGPLFKTKPVYQVQVKSFPVEVQDGAPGGQYTPPAVDGSKPGVYWINLKDMQANPKFGLKSLTYHEANPGHHWQAALNLAQESLPFLRRIAPYNAYNEGWALYAEKVAYEMGMYQNDPFGNLGRLQAELFRAVRLVVDTGIHHKQWSREQAIEYMSAQTGSAASDVVTEIERYMAWPGQALGYKLGMIKILELREKAKASLGKQFDLAEFHDLVLLGGAVPMSVLEQKIARWIEAKKKTLP